MRGKAEHAADGETMMQAELYLMAVQALLGVFDIVYHHELTERITWLAWNGTLAWPAGAAEGG